MSVASGTKHAGGGKPERPERSAIFDIRPPSASVLCQLDSLLLQQFSPYQHGLELTSSEGRSTEAVNAHEPSCRSQENKSGGRVSADSAEMSRTSGLKKVFKVARIVGPEAKAMQREPSAFTPRSQVVRRSCWVRIVENPLFLCFFMSLTFYALFVPDVDVIVGNKESKYVLSIVTFAICILFSVELVLQSLGKSGYFLGAYFWLDFLAMVSLVPDTWLMQMMMETNAFAAGRSSRLVRLIRVASRSTKATRLNRVVQIVRLKSILIQVGAYLGRDVHDDTLDKLVEKKLRRVFQFLDDDMDGLIHHTAVINCLDRIKGGEGKPKERLGSKFNTLSKSAACLVKKALRTPSSPRLSNHNDVDESVQPVNCTLSGFTSECTGVKDDHHPVNFERFTTIMMGDACVSSKLRTACWQQQQADGNQNLTNRHSERISVKAALGVLLLVFVLSMVEPATEDLSPYRAIEFLSTTVRSRYQEAMPGDPIPKELVAQVNFWMQGIGPDGNDVPFKYLDLQRKVYCNELVSTGESCSDHGQTRYWGERKDLGDIRDDMTNSDFRRSDMNLATVPESEDDDDDDLSGEALDERTDAAAVLFIRGQVQKAAWFSIMTTISVIAVIMIGILLLTKDLKLLAQSILMPLQELADDMESIGQLQLAGVFGVEENDAHAATSEIRLIRKTFENMKKAIKSWGKYVPWPVVQILLRASVEANIEVKEEEVSIYFSDIASFTTIVENMPPESSLLLLSRYFNDMSQVIDDHNGVVLEYIGDAILCIYGAPLQNDDHATAACKSALRMLSVLKRMNEWSVSRELPEVSIRCGVHTGKVLVGNMGFQSRMKYGIVGEDAHIASTLEELNKSYSTQMLISDDTRSRLQPDTFITRPVDYVQLRPHTSGELIHHVMDRRSRGSRPAAMLTAAALHAEAMKSYRQQKFKVALQKFEKVGSMMGEITGKEDTASALLATRCRAYLIDPPGSDWNGVWDRGGDGH